MPAARDGYEMRSDVDVDVVHIGIGHGAPLTVIGDQPFDDLLLMATRVKVDGIATSVLRGPAGAGDGGAGSARGDKLNRAESSLNSLEQSAGGWHQAGARRVGRIVQLGVERLTGAVANEQLFDRHRRLGWRGLIIGKI